MDDEAVVDELSRLAGLDKSPVWVTVTHKEDLDGRVKCETDVGVFYCKGGCLAIGCRVKLVPTGDGLWETDGCRPVYEAKEEL